MVMLMPDMHESFYQRAIKAKIEDALRELNLSGYRVVPGPYENRSDLRVIDDSEREILVVEVKKTKQDVNSPRYWDQARKYVLNSIRWRPRSPKIFSITNAEELCVFCLREDFTHIKYCLLKHGKISNGSFGSNGEADEVLHRYKDSIKDVLKICQGITPIEYDENWFPLLERFRVELETLSLELWRSLERKLSSDPAFRRSFDRWSSGVYSHHTDEQIKDHTSRQIASSMLFKALCYEVIRNLLRGVPLARIKNVRLRPLRQIGDINRIIEMLAEIYTDIMRIDYRQMFEIDPISSTISISRAGKESIGRFVRSLVSVANAQQEISDPDFLIASLVDSLVPITERHFTGLTIEEPSMCDLLADLCISKHSDHVLDIAAGTFSILQSAYHRLLRLKKARGRPVHHRNVLRQIHIIETDGFIARLGILRFALLNLLEETEIDITLSDSFNVPPRADMDVLLCNPPYLRQADIPHAYKEAMRSAIQANYRAQGYRNYSAFSLGQSDKYFYFVEWGVLFLKPGGIAGFILSDKFLDSKNGRYLRAFLKENTNIKAVIKYSGKYFEGFDITTCFLIAQRKRGRRSEMDNKVRFIRLHEDLPPERVRELLNCESDINTLEATVVVETQSVLSPEEKWGKKLLRLPTCYDYCLSRDFIKSLGGLFGSRKKRGKDNGCNAFFFPRSTGFNRGKKEPEDDFRERRRRFEAQAVGLVHNIEAEFLRDGLNSADLPRHYSLTAADINEELLLVISPTININSYMGLNAFVNFANRVYADSNGEERALLDGNLIRIRDRPTVGNRSPWYSLYPHNNQEDNYAIIIPRMHRSKFKILIPRSRVFFSTNFVGFGMLGTMDEIDIKFLAGFLMSSLGQLQFEKEGDWREGLLKIEAGELYKIKLPDPSSIDVEVRSKIAAEFQSLVFGLNGLESPGPGNPRLNLDMAVMEMYYPPEERLNKVIEIEQALFQAVLERDPMNRTR